MVVAVVRKRVRGTSEGVNCLCGCGGGGLFTTGTTRERGVCCTYRAFSLGSANQRPSSEVGDGGGAARSSGAGDSGRRSSTPVKTESGVNVVSSSVVVVQGKVAAKGVADVVKALDDLNLS